MDEAAWLSCRDPAPMLEFLRDKVSDRKLRLFSCACCRLIWDQIKTAACHRAVEIGESYADGQVQKKYLKQARSTSSTSMEGADHVAWCTVRENAAIGARDAARAAAWLIVARPVTFDGNKGWSLAGNLNDAEARLAEILRDLVGSPLRAAFVDHGWLSWNDGAVVKLDEAIYTERALDRLPILADALEDAGCTDATILRHCRQPGEHVHGCWVVDLILGKS
jgi:hypothetical protein